MSKTADVVYEEALAAADVAFEEARVTHIHKAQVEAYKIYLESYKARKEYLFESLIAEVYRS